MDDYRKIAGLHYTVSKSGEIINRETGHKLKQFPSTAGYLSVGMSKEGKTKTYSVHRLVAKAFIPNPENKPEVNHKDGNKFNNNVDNLEWVTGAENKRHCREVLGKINRNPDTTAANKATKKRVRCVNTGVEYESITCAAKAIGASQGMVSSQLTGRNKTCKGLVFEYVG